MRIIPTITVTPHAIIPSRLLSSELASHASVLRRCMTIISIIIRNVTTVRILRPPVYSALPSRQKRSVALVFAKFSAEPCHPERQVDKVFLFPPYKISSFSGYLLHSPIHSSQCSARFLQNSGVFPRRKHLPTHCSLSFTSGRTKV